MNQTDEQKAIVAAVAGKGNVLAKALAGTGKSTTLKMALATIPQKSVLICAFNKRIADEFEQTMPKAPRGSIFTVKTFHSLGLSVLASHFKGHCKVSPQATEDIVNRAAGHAISFKMRRAAVRLLRILKETYAEHATPDDGRVLALGLEYQLFDKLSEIETGLTVEVVRDAYVLSLSFESRDSIDFCDMVWGPVARDLEPKSRYQAVMVDELQDISRPQLALIRKVLIPNGKFVGVGDLQQQIYGWRGSMGGAAWSQMKEDFQAKELPLTMTWRCSKAVVEVARAIVPALRARPDAPVGAVQDCTWDNLPRSITGNAQGGVHFDKPGKIHTFVLSRNNAMLVDCALFLWRSKVRFELNSGKELLDPIFTILETKLDTRNQGVFHASLKKWRDTELARAEKLNAAAYADSVEEQAAMLAVAAQYTEPAGIKRLLTDIINPNDSGVLLSTVHKVKGLEAERVFLLKQTFARHDDRSCIACGGSGDENPEHPNSKRCGKCHGTGRWIKPAEPEELNIEYVGITRAISRLVWVNVRARRDLVLAAFAMEANDREHAAGGNSDITGEDIREVLDGESSSLQHAMDKRKNRKLMTDLTGIKVKSEREQLLEQSTSFVGGLSRAQAEAILSPPQGEMAQYYLDQALSQDDGENEDRDEDRQFPPDPDDPRASRDRVAPAKRRPGGDAW